MTDSNIIYETIQPGDTLWDLAEWYGTTVEEIVAANPGVDPENLLIDQEVAIPGVPLVAEEEQWPLPGRGPWGPPPLPPPPWRRPRWDWGPPPWRGPWRPQPGRRPWGPLPPPPRRGY